VLGDEGITWMGQPSRQGIALFSVHTSHGEFLQVCFAKLAEVIHPYCAAMKSSELTCPIRAQ
jgi:hypothetical protein